MNRRIDPPESKHWFYEISAEGETLPSFTFLATILLDAPKACLVFSEQGCSWLREAGFTQFTRSPLPPPELPVQAGKVLELAWPGGTWTGGLRQVLFYCGIQLVNRQGTLLGYLIVMDEKHKQPGILQHSALIELASGIVDHLEILHENHTLKLKIQARPEKNRHHSAYQNLLSDGPEPGPRYSQLWVAENLEQAVSISDPDGRVLWVNPAFTRLTGFELHEITGKSCSDLLYGEKTCQQTIQRKRRHAESGTPTDVELQLYTKSGHVYWASVHTSVVTDRDGHGHRIITVISDISDKKKKDLELETLSLAAMKSSGGIGVLDRSGKLLWINESLEKMLGYTRDELRKMDFRSAFLGENTDTRLWDRILNISQARPYQAEIELYTRESKPSWFQISKNPVLNAAGKVERTVFLLIDMTARKQVELRFQKLSSIATHSSNAILFRHLGGHITWVNGAFERIFGYTYEEATGSSDYELLTGPKTDLKELRKALQHIKAGRNGQYEQTLYHKDGSIRHVIANGNPVFGPNGKPRAVAWTLTDITDVRQKEQEIKKLSLIASESPNAIMVRDQDGRVTWINKAFEALSGYSLQELREDDTILIFGDRTNKKAHDPSCLAGKKGKKANSELFLTRKGGQALWISLKMFPISNFSGELESTVYIINDITERKKAEQELTMLSLVASKTVIGVVINDRHRRTQWVNSSFEKITGYGIDDVRGKILGNVLKGPQTDTNELRRIRQRTLEKESYYTELQVQKKDGTAFWMAASGTPVFDEQGALIQEVEIIDDITQRKYAELQMIRTGEEALRLSRAKEAFLSAMSHEIRTPLNSVIGITQLLMDENPSAEQLEYLNLLKFSGDNLKALINDILDLTKIETGNLTLEKAAFSLTELVDQTISSLQVIAGENNTRLSLSVDPRIPAEITGDSVRIFQILMNLLGNAIKFTKDGQVKLKLRLMDGKQGTLKIAFEISDTGIGIPEDKLETIFEPYKQASEDTARTFGGTGLGLAIVKQLLQLHGSTIQVKSQPGTGSAFTFAIEFEKASDSGSSGTKDSLEQLRILVVDDQEINRKIACKILAGLKALPDSAENGQSALEKIEKNEYHCILMDLHMPVMNGIETAEKIRGHKQACIKNVPIIAITGSTDEHSIQQIGSSGMNGYITKPFTAKDLLEAIKKHTPSIAHKTDLPIEK